MSSLEDCGATFVEMFLHDIYKADTYWSPGSAGSLYFLIHLRKVKRMRKSPNQGTKNEVLTIKYIISWVYTCRNILKICQIFLQAKSSMSVKWWQAL